MGDLVSWFDDNPLAYAGDDWGGPRWSYHLARPPGWLQHADPETLAKAKAIFDNPNIDPDVAIGQLEQDFRQGGADRGLDIDYTSGNILDEAIQGDYSPFTAGARAHEAPGYESVGSVPAPSAAGAGSPPSAGTGGSYGALAFPGPMAGYGAPPAPFGETYQPLARPASLGEYAPGQWTETFSVPEKPRGLETPYAAPTWQGGDFQAPAKPTALQTPYALPTQAELEASPGYLSAQSAMQRGMERSAASRGSVLSGGFVGRTLPRAMGEYAGTAYGNLVGQTLGARQQQTGEYQADVGNALTARGLQFGEFLDTANLGIGTRQQQVVEYQGDVSNAFNQYLQRYGQFSAGEDRRRDARDVNESAFRGDQAANLTGYNTRYGKYLDTAGLQRQAETDLWSRNRDLSDLSLRAAALARP